MTAPSAATTTDIDLAPYLNRSDRLSSIPWLVHGVTSRVTGLGLADGNVGYTAPRDETDAWTMRQLWSRSLGMDPRALVRVRQLHGNDVHVATEADLDRGAHPNALEAPVADSVITNRPGLALATLHADCLAMFIVDPPNRAVAAVHAGWRSTVLDVAGETVRTMASEFGSDPATLIAYVGPSIGWDRYQVGSEVVDAWRQIAPTDDTSVDTRPEGLYFDLKQANRSCLRMAGIEDSNIDVSSVCTASDPEHWFSHRAQGPLTGRFAAIIAIKGDKQ